MSTKFEISTKVQGQKMLVHFSGSIDEDSTFDEILEVRGISDYVFDFDKIDMINSCGVREWTAFVKALGENCSIKYTHCRQIIIEQINMVHGFIPQNAVIESFYAPYYCEELDKEYKILLESKEVKGKQAPKVNCPDGDYEMEFDAIEGQYFNFIK